MIKRIIITDDTTNEEIEYIHDKAMKEYVKKGYSTYLIIDKDEM